MIGYSETGRYEGRAACSEALDGMSPQRDAGYWLSLAS